MMIGTRLGPYEITSKLGEGGMGEVYRATDTRLGREVAIKVLPESVAQDPERLARFEREAKVLAALNHSHIAVIYGIEETGTTRALIMELVEGLTLGERLARGPLPLREALSVARQIAEALEYAHENGIIHRDLKPANIKLAADDQVKLLDFGLAKALDPDSAANGPVNLSRSPTLSKGATVQGVILGTAGYMAPEQAAGKAVDKRVDIWAFGVVLYEMLTGNRLFAGDSVPETLARVLEGEIDLERLPKETPWTIRRLLVRCLERDPKLRLRDIGEARIAIGSALADPGGADSVADGAVATEGGKRRTGAWLLGAALGGLLVGALIAGLLVRRSSAPARPRLPVVAYVPPPRGTTFHGSGPGAGPVAVSPDGTRLAFSATDESGTTRLYLRPLASDRATAVAGTEGAAMPFWSQDGESLGFFADKKLKAVDIASGGVHVLADDSCAIAGAAWSSKGIILLTPRCAGPLERVSSSSGGVTPVTRLAQGELGQAEPFFLPDGRHFLYTSVGKNLSRESIWMGSLGSKARKLLLRDAGLPRFALGYLLFLRDHRVLARRFDPATGELKGKEVALAEARSYYSVSGTGVLAFQQGSPSGRMEWFDRDGNATGTVGPVARYWAARVSPHGERILADVFDPGSGSADLWSYPADGGPGTRLTFQPGESKSFSVWSPDGKSIAYSCASEGKQGICRKPADGSGAKKTLLTLGADVLDLNVVDWSADGRYISYDTLTAKDAGYRLWILPLFGDRRPFRPDAGNANQYEGEFSPDSQWIAYLSHETGRLEVFVAPISGSGARFQISQNGGWLVRWDGQGRIYFVTMGNRLMEAELEERATSLRVKALRPLFRLSLPRANSELFDVNSNGSRFLVITSANPEASRSIGLLLDWPAKLKGA